MTQTFTGPVYGSFMCNVYSEMIGQIYEKTSNTIGRNICSNFQLTNDPKDIRLKRSLGKSFFLYVLYGHTDDVHYAASKKLLKKII